jgi:hypothetical protein
MLRIFVLCLAAAASLLAQTANSTLTGYITDPAGTLVPAENSRKTMQVCFPHYRAEGGSDGFRISRRRRSA